MSAETRRKQIMLAIQQSKQVSLSASKLAQQFGVSRQVIVGDIALLRAQGYDIIATARGYVMVEFTNSSQYVGKIASLHKANEIKDELYTIVDLKATIVNVIVEHEIYGELTGNLNLSTRVDVDDYLARLRKSDAKPLSALTDGIHLHTIICQDQNHYEEIVKALKAKKLTYQ